MTTNQLSKLKMYLSLRLFLTSNEDIMAKLPNSGEFIAALDVAILQIQTNDEEHQQSNKGVTDKKNKLKDDLITLAADNSRKIQAYAKYNHNEVLLAETKITLTELRSFPGVELVNVANGLYHSIEENLTEVTAYNLTEVTQTKFRETIDLFSTSIPQPRESLLKGKENIMLQNQGFEAGDEAIGNLDAVVEIVRLTEPTFYAGYRNTRKIVLQGTGSLQVNGTVTESATGKPIPKATLTFRLTGQQEVVVEKESAAKGGFMIKSLAEGVYEVTVTKVGFQTQVAQLIVRWDELCTLDVKMEGI
ncbi:MAG: carboxypeptidase-like regulatory domain-containing protein [Bacteroidales bacterium]